MTKYFVIDWRTENSYTADHGYGDYPERVRVIVGTVEAETVRKAQNKARKEIDPSLRFGGQFGARIVDEQWMATVGV
jgi:hypothetical protein